MTVRTTFTTGRDVDRRRGPGARRFGYLVALLVNGALLYAVNRWPGWETAGFLNAETPQVLGWVNASITVSLVANLGYLVSDPPRIRALGDLATTTIGLVAMLRIWQVFPFDFPEGGFDWTLLVRVLLAVGIVGSGIGIVVALVSLARPGRGTRRASRGAES